MELTARRRVLMLKLEWMLIAKGQLKTAEIIFHDLYII